MVHPAIKQYIQVQPTSYRLSSSTVISSPSLESTSYGVPNIGDNSSPSPHHPSLATSSNSRDLNSSNSTSVHDLQMSLCKSLDTMTPLEFSKALHSHIQFVLNHWPPHSVECDSNPLSSIVSTTNGSEDTVTTASVIGLVKFFSPAAKQSPFHDQSQMPLSDLHHQLHQIEIFLTFLSVSELMQVFRARLKAPNGIIYRPNVLLGLRDVMRNKLVAADSSGPTSENSLTPGKASPLATSESAISEVEGGLVDSRVVSEASRCASRTPRTDMYDGQDQRSWKKVKIDLESRLDDPGSSQHFKSLYMADDKPSHHGRSQQRSSNHVPSIPSHPISSRSLRKTAKNGSSSSSYTRSEGRSSFTLAELAGWKGSPLMVEACRTDALSIFDDDEDGQSAQIDPLPSTVLHKPSTDDEDLYVPDTNQKVPVPSGPSDLAHPRAFRVDGHVAVDPKSLSHLMKIAPRATFSSQDTFGALGAMDAAPASSNAFIATSSLSRAWRTGCSPRG